MNLVHKNKDAIVKEIKHEEKKEVKQGAIKMHKGHTLFEINLKTKEINEAVFKSVDYVVTDTTMNQASKKIIENENCIYIPALNKNSALKKLFKKIGK